MDENRLVPVGEIIDGLGVKASLYEGDLLEGAVVLLKVVEADGEVRLSAAWSEGMSWLERAGMIAHANVSELENETRPGDE